MTSINKFHHSLWKDLLERFCTRRNEDGVVFAPNGKDGWLIVTEVAMEGRIELDIVLVYEI